MDVQLSEPLSISCTSWMLRSSGADWQAFVESRRLGKAGTSVGGGGALTCCVSGGGTYNGVAVGTWSSSPESEFLGGHAKPCVG